jgi:hypothetical protein
VAHLFEVLGKALLAFGEHGLQAFNLSPVLLQQLK